MSGSLSSIPRTSLSSSVGEGSATLVEDINSKLNTLEICVSYLEKQITSDGVFSEEQIRRVREVFSREFGDPEVHGESVRQKAAALMGRLNRIDELVVKQREFDRLIKEGEELGGGPQEILMVLKRYEPSKKLLKDAVRMQKTSSRNTKITLALDAATEQADSDDDGHIRINPKLSFREKVIGTMIELANRVKGPALSAVHDQLENGGISDPKDFATRIVLIEHESAGLAGNALEQCVQKHGWTGVSHFLTPYREGGEMSTPEKSLEASKTKKRFNPSTGRTYTHFNLYVADAKKVIKRLAKKKLAAEATSSSSTAESSRPIKGAASSSISTDSPSRTVTTD